MPDHNHNDTVAGTQAQASRSFATPTGGYDYFASGAHYISLARLILAALDRGKRLVVLIGDPAPNSVMLRDALADAAVGKHEAVEIVSGGTFNGDHLHRSSARSLVVIDDAGKAGARELGEICDHIVKGQSSTCSAVLPGRPELIARLEESRPSISHHTHVARLDAYQLDREETGSFIRRQLPPGAEVSALTPEAIDGIADFSGGDPAQVNRLARLMLDFPHWAGNLEETAAASVVAEPPLSTPLRRRRLAWAASIGLLLCATVAVVFQAGPGRVSSDSAIAGPAAPEAPSEPLPSEVSQAALETVPANQAQREAAPPAEEAATPEPPVIAPDPPDPTVSAAQSAPAPQPRLSAEAVLALVARGDVFVQMRDIASARLFYERAADAGNSRAALRMGESFDPAFLDRIGVRSIAGDRGHALFWYRRARDLGDADAARVLGKLEPHEQ